MRTWRAVPFDPDQDALRRRPRLSPATPRPSSASVLGSGTPLPPNFIVKLRIVGSAKRKADRKTALSFRLVSALRNLQCRRVSRGSCRWATCDSWVRCISQSKQADSIRHLQRIFDGSATRSVIKNAPRLRAARQSEQTLRPELNLVGCIDRPIPARRTMQPVIH